LTTDRVLFLLVATLILTGVIFSYSLSVYFVQIYGYAPFHFLVREAFAGILGIGLMWGISRLNPEIWLSRRVSFPRMRTSGS